MRRVMTMPAPQPIKTDLSRFDSSWYVPGSKVKWALWYLVSALFFINPLFTFSAPKVMWLRLFGARIGRRTVIKPRVVIKFPWNLAVGDNVWIGEGVWIENQAAVTVGDNCCLSQASMLLTGNHDYKKPAFDLVIAPVVLEEGVWVGAHAVVCPGVTCRSHAVLAVNSVATSDLEPYSVYQGNPAVRIRERKMDAAPSSQH